MTISPAPRRASVRLVTACIAAVALAACASTTDSLLKVDNPDIIDPKVLQNTEGALGLASRQVGGFEQRPAFYSSCPPAFAPRPTRRQGV